MVLPLVPLRITTAAVPNNAKVKATFTTTLRRVPLTV
jgi:hypothetical protein